MTFVNFSAHAPNPIAAGPQAAVDSAAAATGDDAFSFNDLLDIVNPLQHIPVVGTLYRAISGDTIKTGPKIAGDTLYGGLTGFASSVGDMLFEKITGKNVGDTVLAMVEDIFKPSDPASPTSANTPATAVANADAPPALPAAANLPVLSAANLGAGIPSVPMAPVQVQTAAQDAIVIPGQDELLMALSRAGIGQDVALRAADAYRRTVNVSTAAANAALPNDFRATLAQ